MRMATLTNRETHVWFLFSLPFALTYVSAAQGFCEMMGLDVAVLIGVQTLALRKFQTLFADLTVIFDVDWVANAIVSFVRAADTRGQKKLIDEKVELLISLAGGDLFRNPEVRALLLPCLIDEAMAFISNPESSPQTVVSALTVVGQMSDQLRRMEAYDILDVVFSITVFVEPLLTILEAQVCVSCIFIYFFFVFFGEKGGHGELRACPLSHSFHSRTHALTHALPHSLAR